jgi:hypothetical protein
VLVVNVLGALAAELSCIVPAGRVNVQPTPVLRLPRIALHPHSNHKHCLVSRVGYITIKSKQPPSINIDY